MATREHGLYRLLARPAADAAHGGCYLTGAQGACVDTGILIENEGTLTIGLNPLVELCEVAGFSFNAEARKLEENLAHAQEANRLLIEQNSELRQQLDAVGVAVAYAANNKTGAQTGRQKK